VIRERDDLRTLFDVQWTRMGEASERWRAEDPAGRALMRPDLGALLKWLMDDVDRACAERDQWQRTASDIERMVTALTGERDRAQRAAEDAKRSLDTTSREHDRRRRVWLGPVEPVTDDGGAG
jgi:hypothetical protein